MFSHALAHWLTFWIIIVSMMEVLAIAGAIEALLLARTPQSALAWCLSLIIFPIIALPLYWILGRQHFHGYRETLSRMVASNRLSIEKYLQAVESFVDYPAELKSPFAVSLERIAESHFLGQNEVDLLIDGEQTFAGVFNAMDQAKSYIFVQFYIVRDDRIGAQLKEKLIQRALAGIRVFFLYDEVGSKGLSQAYISDLKKAGVFILPFGTRRGWRNKFQINFRNHRKIVVVDGQIGFVGGLNVGDEYLGRSQRFGPWRDTHVRVEGPSVLNMEGAFIADWTWASGNIPDIKMIEPRPAGHKHVLTLVSGPVDERERCSLFFHEAITAAARRIWISSAYFIPDEGILRALQLSALRGVDVRLLIPDKVDHLHVWLAAHTFLPDVCSYGVRVFRYKEGFLHQKVVLIDDEIAAIGTANLDNRSFRLNFEITMVVADPDFNRKVAGMLEFDFARSNEEKITRFSDYPWHLRLGAKYARLFSPIL